MNKDAIKGQLRHFLSTGGWLLFLLVFLPTEWWERALANIKQIGNILGVVGGIVALYAHHWSATDKQQPPDEQ